MTWSYSGDPATNDTDAVRFLVGDTDTNDQLVENEEIDYALAQSTTVYGAAALTCRAIAALFSRDVDIGLSGGDYSESQRAEHYRNLAERFTAMSQNAPLKSGASAPVPFVGGVRQTEMETVQEDDNRVRPAFRAGMFDYHDHGYHEHHH